MILKIPIAWLQLKYQRRQTIAAILGIICTIILLFMQIGFRSSFLNSVVQLASSFQSELILMSSSTSSILETTTFSDRRLYQALAFKEVESATPIYLTQISWKTRQNKENYITGIRVIAFPLTSSVIDLPGVKDNLDKLKIEDVFLLDEKTQSELAPLVSNIKNKGKVITEIKTNSGFKKIKIFGLFQLGSNPIYKGNLITSNSNFLRIFGRERKEVNLALIKLKKEVDIQQTISQMESYFPRDVKILSKSDLIAKEKEFYEHNTPAGLFFLFGLSVSFVIGTVIMYQILYQKISKFIQDYATLKAIGYSHNRLVIIVFQIVLILVILGYIPGLIISYLMYKILDKISSLHFAMTFNAAISVLLSVILICMISALIAVIDLKEADPADIFN